MWIIILRVKYPIRSLTTLINEAPDVCTSLLINQHLKGAYQQWAIVGTFEITLKSLHMAWLNRRNYLIQTWQNLSAWVF